MPTVTTPQELFEHELQDMYYAEKTLINVLPKLAEEATDSELSRAFTSHLKQTEKHAKNLEGVFRSIGKAPQAHPCPGIEGIKKEHDEFVAKEEPSTDVLDMFLTGAATRTEHYEIAAYTGLITMAKALGENDTARLLGENLKDEKAALEMVTTISEKLAGKIPANA